MPLHVAGTALPMVGRVRMYVCGITPYDVTHLGHAATYLWADAADRVLRWHGHTVTVARNVTDVDEVLFAEARRRGEQHSMLALDASTMHGLGQRQGNRRGDAVAPQRQIIHDLIARKTQSSSQ